MKNKFFKISIFLLILPLLILTSCKDKTEYASIKYLNRDDYIVYESKVEVGKKLDENPYVSEEEGTYYLWDFDSAKSEYDLDNVNGTIWIYGDLEYVDVEYKLYYNDELVNTERLKYNLDYTIYPALPENGVKKDERREWNKEDKYLYLCDIYLTYEIVEPTYTITFMDGDKTVLDKINYQKSDSINLPTYEKEGYEFIGWFLSDLSYTPYEKIENMKGDLYLYARFNEIELHESISLPDAKYHFTGVKKVETSISGVYTTQPIFPSGVATAVSNYDWSSSDESIATVSQWSSISAKSAGFVVITATSKTDNNTTINALFKVTVDGITLSSVEEANKMNVYNVRFVGKNDELIKECKIKEYGTLSYPIPPSYDGYTFIGWDNDNYNISNDITIKAQYVSSSTLKNDFVGKSFSIIGDSISTYQDIIPAGFACFYPYPTADVSNYNRTWWMMTINRLGGTLFLNNSYSGSCVAHDSSSSTYLKSRLNYCNVQGQFADVCLIFMGSNDAASSVVSEAKFKERYKIMLDNLIEMAPNMELVLMTLPVSNLYNADRQAAFNKIISDYALEYNFKLVDINDVNITNDLVDSAHPKTSGMKILADAIVDILTKND